MAVDAELKGICDEKAHMTLGSKDTVYIFDKRPPQGRDRAKEIHKDGKLEKVQTWSQREIENTTQLQVVIPSASYISSMLLQMAQRLNLRSQMSQEQVEKITVMIRDLRFREEEFSLKRHSFAGVHVDLPINLDAKDEEALRSRHASDAVQIILKHVEGARQVIVFDTTMRKACNSEVLRRPVRKVHVDQTPLGAFGRVKRHLSEADAIQMSAGRLRVRIINVWRPIVQFVEDHYLAVAESQTIYDEDLVKVKHKYPTIDGETYAVRVL